MDKVQKRAGDWEDAIPILRKNHSVIVQIMRAFTSDAEEEEIEAGDPEDPKGG